MAWPFRSIHDPPGRTNTRLREPSRAAASPKARPREAQMARADGSTRPRPLVTHGVHCRGSRLENATASISIHPRKTHALPRCVPTQFPISMATKAPHHRGGPAHFAKTTPSTRTGLFRNAALSGIIIETLSPPSNKIPDQFRPARDRVFLARGEHSDGRPEKEEDT